MIPLKIQWQFILLSMALVILSLLLSPLLNLWVNLAIILILALTMGYFFSRSLARPLHQITKAARKLTHEEFGQKAQIETYDETAKLATLFNRMVEELESKVTTLSEERTRLSVILTSMVEGVMVLDYRGTILIINMAFERMFQLSGRQIIGRSSLEVLRHYALIELIKAVLDTKINQSREVMVQMGQERYFHVQASVAPNDLAQEVCAVLVFHDITEIKHLERVRKDFVANVSHELRTPLTSIKGYIEALLDGARDDPERCLEFLQILQKHTDRLNNIISDLLTLAQIESGLYVWKREGVKIIDLIGKATALLKPLVERKGHEIQVVAPPDLSPVLGDAEKLTQVMINLLDNAIKYTPDGGKIAIEAKPSGNTIEVTVSDTGIGIPPKDLPRIFERFYRVDQARSRELGGTGLGLSIVKHIVEAHEGRVSVKSEVGKGSKFSVILPVQPSTT